MDKKIFISNYEFMILVCTIISVSNQLSLPMALASVSQQDAWITFFFPLVYSIIVVFLLFRLMRQFPGENLFEISKSICGKWVGGVLNLLLIGYLFYDLVINLRIHADFFNSTMLIRTPIEFILLLTIGLIIFFARGSIEVLARASSLFFPIFFILGLITPFILLNEIDLTEIQPILTKGSSSLIKGGVLGIGGFGDIIALGAFLNNMKNPRGLYVSCKSGIIVSSFILTVWTFLVISVFGATSSSRIIYLGWVLVKQIHITDFLDRVDLVIFSFWLPNLIIKYSILYLAILIGLASFTKSKNYKPINVLTGILVTLVALVAFKNVDEVVWANNYAMAPLTFCIHIIFFCTIFAVLLFRKMRSVSDQAQQKDSKLIWVGLFGCAAAIGASDFLGHSFGIYGIVCGTLYSFFLFISVIFSLMEFRNLDNG
ncbi:MAG: endospore germination permease [Paenibacillaceae bacterium]